MRGGASWIGAEPDAGLRFRAHVASFYLSKLPVTNRQFEAYAPGFARAPASPGDDDPATGVSWLDALGYCDWYAGVSRKPMRLPTEIEWEHACRGGSESRYFHGDDPGAGDAFAWDADNSPPGGVPPLQDRRANPSGLLSMLGGVWEWTSSLYRPFPVGDDDGRDSRDAPGPRVLRGGSWRTPRRLAACGTRRAEDPRARLDDVGFRVARGF